MFQHVSPCFSRFSHRYHIHGIPWYYGRGRREVVTVNLPLEEGGMVVSFPVRSTGGKNCNLGSQDDFKWWRVLQYFSVSSISNVMVTTFEIMMCTIVEYCCLRCMFVCVCVLVVVSTCASPSQVLSNSTSLITCIQLWSVINITFKYIFNIVFILIKYNSKKVFKYWYRFCHRRRFSEF